LQTRWIRNWTKLRRAAIEHLRSQTAARAATARPFLRESVMRKLIIGLVGAMMAIAAAYADPIKPDPIKADPIKAGRIRIVAAENFYGDIAKQIGGPDVTVTSILSNPDQDPHLFEVSPSVGRDVSAANIVIYNGIDYDPWIEKLLGAARSANRKTIVAAALAGRTTGDNPHIWYDPATMLALAKTLCEGLIAEDPARRTGYEQRLTRFEASVKPVQAKIAQLRERLAGTQVTATEPVFGYMLAALGMQVRNQAFQLAVMNNTEPSASDIAAFENDLKTHQVKLLIYNSQATNPIADRMQKIAKASQIPVVAATETEPADKNYQGWMTSELDAVDRALPKQTR
jgi:zinc/manganese transport system substrate-binding protein